MNKKTLELYSSAITLSDMEIFVFPELMYSLVLANIMSPNIWQWREEPTFKKLQGKTPYRKLTRMRQFIMDNYDFNLDLETWGLTERARELQRFEDFIEPEKIEQSNALFGYQGDKYYFDVDIRRHFGLDKYNSDIIPYWKTETVEAMDAFRFKKGYSTGAGECVSLAALYAAAAFVVCDVPLEDIYMILTPLHSQNYIDVDDGLITNNRRIVTKSMWFNGTEITMKAQRALRNERVTIVAHSSGFNHLIYDRATIEKDAYSKFREKLDGFLCADLDSVNMANFLRANDEYRKYFQFCRTHRDVPKFVKAEVLFRYEHGSQFKIAEDTFDKLLAEVHDEDYSPYKYPDRVCCNQLSELLGKTKVDLRTEQGKNKLIGYITPYIPVAEELVEKLADFLTMQPRLPSAEKEYVDHGRINFDLDMGREQIIEYLQSLRDKNRMVDLAFYAYRDMTRCQWEPFIKAALERNPVSLQMCSGKNVSEVYRWLCGMENESIYDGTRIAQPDEVANYNRGDGLEKAFVLANCIHDSEPARKITIQSDGSKVVLQAEEKYAFSTNKPLELSITLPNSD